MGRKRVSGACGEQPAPGLLEAGLAPLALISRRIAEYSVAAGVLTPGLDQSPRLAISSNISLVRIGFSAPARTCAAASMALSLIIIDGPQLDEGRRRRSRPAITSRLE